MKEEIRKLLMKRGAQVCGFANIDRFENAPEGFHPRDIYAQCNTVIVFGLTVPKGLYEVSPRVIYNRYGSVTKMELDRIAYYAALDIERIYGGATVPLPSDTPYECWDEEMLEGKGLLSLRHAAVLAGLGTLGKSSLLVNERFGNMLNLGAVLTDITLSSDPPSEKTCIDSCTVCIDSCPVSALDGIGADQHLCRPNTYVENARGFELTNCNKCRTACPMRFGKTCDDSFF